MATHPNQSRLLAYPVAIGIVGGAFLGLSVARADESPAQQREEITKMASQTLTELYREVPGAKSAVKSAPGYGVFSNFGMKILVLGTGKGEGVVVNKNTQKKTF